MDKKVMDRKGKGGERDGREPLMARLRNQDESALEELVKAYEADIFQTVRRVVRNVLRWEDIQEIVNDTFYQVWRHAENLDERKGSVQAYLTVTARNLAKNRLREYRGGMYQIQDYDTLETTELYDRAEQAEREQIVRDALNRLSAVEKEVFIRYYYLYQTTEEIGVSMGLKKNTVKSKLKRGRSKLKGFLTESSAFQKGE